MAVRITAADLREGDVIHFGGARAHIAAVRRHGALVVVLIEELGASLTYASDHPVVLLARPDDAHAERSAQRRLRRRGSGPSGVRKDSGFPAAFAQDAA